VEKNPGGAISSRSLLSAFWTSGFVADVQLRFMLADTLGGFYVIYYVLFK
jgi:hypothetical protein